MTKAEKTKAFIIEQTAPLFNIKGYAGTSIYDVMHATELSKGCIYGHFKNKDEVALAAFEYNHEKVNEHIRSRIAATDNAIERLMVYPQTYRNYFRYPYLQAGCPIMNMAVEADDTHPVLKERAAKALNFWQTAIENQIKRGIKRNEIKKDTNPEAFAIIMISLIEGALMQAKTTSKTKELKQTMSFLEKLISDLAV